MPNEKKQFVVADYMQTELRTITPQTTLKEAIRAMMNYKTNGLVVVDGHKHVVGILSSWDIIQHVVPDYLEHDKHLAAFEAGDVFAGRIEEVKNNPVETFMTKQVRTVTPDDLLIEVVTMLSQFHIRQMPVVDENGCMCGYINRTDVKRAIADILKIKYKK